MAPLDVCFFFVINFKYFKQILLHAINFKQLKIQENYGNVKKQMKINKLNFFRQFINVLFNLVLPE